MPRAAARVNGRKFTSRVFKVCPTCPLPQRPRISMKEVRAFLGITAQAVCMRKRRFRVRRTGKRTMRRSDVCKICCA